MDKDAIVTCDLSQFGYCELGMAGDLLNAYAAAPLDCLRDGITLNLNTHSGNVFLSDADFNVVMMNGDELEQFFSCPECGHEGFKEEMKHIGNENCEQYLKEIGVG